MTTDFFRTTSNRAQITDREAVADILNDYEAACHPDLNTDDFLVGDSFAIQTPDMANNGFFVNRVDGDQTEYEMTEDMYERIAPYLTEPLTVTTVQTEGAGNSNISVTITPDGEITRTNNTQSEGETTTPSTLELTVEEAQEKYLNGDLSIEDADTVEPDDVGFDNTFNCKDGYFVVTERIVETHTEDWESDE